MSVLCLAACGILNYPEYVRQLLTVAIVNLPQRRAERAQGRHRPTKEKEAGTPQRATTWSTFWHPMRDATTHT